MHGEHQDMPERKVIDQNLLDAFRIEFESGKTWGELVEKETNRCWKSLAFRFTGLAIVILLVATNWIYFYNDLAKIVWCISIVLILGLFVDIYAFASRTYEIGNAYSRVHLGTRPPSVRVVLLQLLVSNLLPIMLAVYLGFYFQSASR